MSALRHDVGRVQRDRRAGVKWGLKRGQVGAIGGQDLDECGQLKAGWPDCPHPKSRDVAAQTRRPGCTAICIATRPPTRASTPPRRPGRAWPEPDVGTYAKWRVSNQARREHGTRCPKNSMPAPTTPTIKPLRSCLTQTPVRLTGTALRARTWSTAALRRRSTRSISPESPVASPLLDRVHRSPGAWREIGHRPALDRRPPAARCSWSRVLRRLAGNSQPTGVALVLCCRRRGPVTGSARALPNQAAPSRTRPGVLQQGLPRER
jgi:hypothetical protein